MRSPIGNSWLALSPVSVPAMCWWLRIRGDVNVRSGRLGVCGPGRRQGADPRRGGVFAERGATGGARGDIVQEIIAIVRQIASGLPPEQGNPLDDGLPGG